MTTQGKSGEERWHEECSYCDVLPPLRRLHQFISPSIPGSPSNPSPSASRRSPDIHVSPFRDETRSIATRRQRALGTLALVVSGAALIADSEPPTYLTTHTANLSGSTVTLSETQPELVVRLRGTASPEAATQGLPNYLSGTLQLSQLGVDDSATGTSAATDAGVNSGASAALVRVEVLTPGPSGLEPFQSGVFARSLAMPTDLSPDCPTERRDECTLDAAFRFSLEEQPATGQQVRIEWSLELVGRIVVDSKEDEAEFPLAFDLSLTTEELPKSGLRLMP